jgi:hypothetical protein
MTAFESPGTGILAGVGGAVVGFVAIALMRIGPWGAESTLARACRRAGLSKEEAVPYLPVRLKYAPDIREFLDATGFKQERQARLDGIQSHVKAVLAEPLSVAEAQVRKAALNPTGEVILAADTADKAHTVRLHAIHVVGKVISDEMQRILSARAKRAGQIMLDSIGMHADVNTALQVALAQANAEMAQEWAKFYALYAILGGALMNVLRGWEEEEAIDTLMAWPGELRPFLGLASFLQGFWGARAEGDVPSPRVTAGRVMCWVYCYPDRWETLKRTMEMACVHEAALRQGKIATHALKAPWHQFAGEIARLATIVAEKKEHKEGAKATLEHCRKL